MPTVTKNSWSDIPGIYAWTIIAPWLEHEILLWSAQQASDWLAERGLPAQWRNEHHEH